VDSAVAVVFEVDGTHVPFSEPEARVLTDKLRGYAAGKYPKDVAALASSGIDPSWLEGALSAADAIQDALPETREGAILLDANSKATAAIYAVLRFSGPVSSDLTSAQAQLFNALSEARE